MSQPKFVIVDGNAIIHRAYHAIPPLTTKDGIVINAVYGFVSMMIKMLNDLKPEYIAVTFDLAGPTFRHKQYTEYKATRVKADQALYDQIPLVKEVVKAFNFPIYCKEGYEADDVIGTITKIVYDEPFEIFVVTGDMDTLQLVNSKVKIYTLRKGLSDVVVYDEHVFEERFGFSPKLMVDYKALRGDASDNIPGVSGIGEKGASELIQKVGTIEEIYSQLDSLIEKGFKKSLIEKLRAGKENALLSKQLSLIDCGVPDFNFKLEDCHIKEFDRQKLVELFQKLEFVSLLKRIPQFQDGTEKTEKEKPIKKTPDFSFEEIKDEAALKKIITAIKQKESYSMKVVFEGQDVFSSKILGLAVAVGENNYYLEKDFLESFSEIFKDEEIELIGHDLKQVIKILQIAGFGVKNKLFDTMIASYLLNPGSRANDIPSLVLKVLGKELTAGSGQESLFGVDKRTICYETFLVYQISARLKKELSKSDSELMDKIETPLIPVLSRMELVGVAIDKQNLLKFSKELNQQIEDVTRKIYKEAGEEFNISSPIQLREVLFEKMKIPTDGVKKGKTGLSTSAEELDKLKEIHPIISLISIYRELTKLQNTYVDALPKLIESRTGRIHTTFNQTIAATGRLTSSDPNLQNIPIRTELGRKIREAFVAEKGFELVSADYSQIELRVVASLAKDKKMIEIFQKDEDIHRATAAAIHGVPLEKVTKEMRYSAKEVNFGVLYGMGVFGLSSRADISREEAREFISKYFEEFSSVKNFIDQTLNFVRKEGYCETLFHRRRYLPELISTNFQVRSAAERMAINHPVQGTAADIIKLAMIEIDEMIMQKYKKGEVKMVLQVHDELLFEVKESLATEVCKEIKSIMEKVVELEVPLKVEIGFGKSWGEIK